MRASEIVAVVVELLAVTFGPLSACLADGPTTLACGRGWVRLSDPQPLQGEVVRLEVGGSSSLPSASWDGGVPRFWRAQSGHSVALLGVDVELSPGSHPLEVEPEPGAGCRVRLEVRGGNFAVERLTLPHHLVELAPKDLERALREADRLEALFSVSSDTRLWNGGMQSPLDDVEPRRNFGRRRILNGEPRSPHSGIDYPARAGTPVRAVGGGRVVLVDTLFFTGRTVVLDHGLGLFSVYAHLSEVSVEQGQQLSKAEIVGRVGATGRVTGPHLHLSVRLNSARVSPLGLLDTDLGS